MKLTEDTIIRTHELSQRQESDDEILIGRPDIGQYIVLPAFAVEIIELLNQGQKIGEVKHYISQKIGEDVDVIEFVQDLIIEYQFVHIVDGVEVNEAASTKEQFPWITENLGKFFFNKITFILYAVVIMLGVAVVLFDGKYFPVYSDIFAFPSITASLTLVYVASWFFLFIHEFAHMVAARSLGIKSTLRFSHRLFFMVAETDMSNIVLVPAQYRYRAFLAGMTWDCVFLSLGMLLLFFNDSGLLFIDESFISSIKAINLTFVMSLAFQFMFFMKTDIYFVFTTFFKCNNLLDNTYLYIKGFLKKLDGTSMDEWNGISHQEKKVIKVYSVFVVAGLIWSIYFFSFYYVRQLIDIVFKIINQMSQHTIISWQYADGAFLVLLTLFPLTFVILSWIKNLRKKRLEEMRKKTLRSMG